MKINRILSGVIFMALALLTMTFSGCNKDDESGTVILESFGPSPALRGGNIYFLGQNLDKVTTIVFPENVEVSDFELESNNRIKAKVPQEAEPGHVRLLLADGTEVVSKATISFTEPIEISEISPMTVRPGEQLTIKGDYLNLIERVTFTGGAEVTSEEFATWERAQIVLTVPMEAQSGIITLSDNAVEPIELESEEEINVVLPSVNSVASFDDVKPGDRLEVTGSDLDLVASVLFQGEISAEVEVGDGKLSFTVPSGAADGEMSLVAYSGLSVVAANITMAVPENLVVEPASGIKANDVIKVKGKNMDVVTTVVFPGVANAVEPQAVSESEISVLVPEGVVSGDIVLNTASGKTSTVAVSTLKAVVNEYNPSPVVAGEDLELRGENLDMVSAVTFGGEQNGKIISQSATSLTVTVPLYAESGAVVLTLGNGETVECATLTVNAPSYCYFASSADERRNFVAGEVAQITVNNASQLTDVRINGTSVEYSVQGDVLWVYIPSSATGTATMTLVSSSDEVEYTVNVVSSGAEQLVTVWEGTYNIGSWSSLQIDKSMFAELEAGNKIRVSFTLDMSYNYWQMSIKSMESGWPQYAYADLTAEDTRYELAVDAALVDVFKNNGMVVTGCNYVVSKVEIVK